MIPDVVIILVMTAKAGPEVLEPQLFLSQARQRYPKSLLQSALTRTSLPNSYTASNPMCIYIVLMCRAPTSGSCPRISIMCGEVVSNDAGTLETLRLRWIVLETWSATPEQQKIEVHTRYFRD